MRRKIGEICEIVSGTTPKTGRPEYWGGECKWITPAELNDDSYFIYDTERKLTQLGVAEAGLHAFPAGTVLLSSRAPIGKVAIAGTAMTCNQGFKNLICTQSVHNRFLYWFLKSQKNYLISLGRGATFKEISKAILADVEMELPSLDKQIEIADQFESITSLIMNRRAQIVKLDELIKARFVEMFGVIRPDSSYTLLKEVCKIERGGSPRPISDYVTDNNDGVNWIKIGDANPDGYIYSTAEKIRREGVKKSRFVKTGDLLLSNSMSFGRPYILKIDGCIHDGWLVLQFDKGILNTTFMRTYLSMPEVYDIFTKMAVGGVVNNLNKDMVGKLPIFVPEIARQTSFAAFVEQVDKSKVVVQKALDKAQQLYDSLMQQYFD